MVIMIKDGVRKKIPDCDVELLKRYGYTVVEGKTETKVEPKVEKKEEPKVLEEKEPVKKPVVNTGKVEKKSKLPEGEMF